MNKIGRKKLILKNILPIIDEKQWIGPQGGIESKQTLNTV